MKEINFDVNTDSGDFDIQANVRFIGNDLLVAIWGGEKPHIGAVSVAQPRPSLKDPKSISSTASVICLLGHKEDELAKAASEILSAALNTRVVVSAGIHWDNLDEKGIERVIENSRQIVDIIIDKILCEFASNSL
ncbi:MAG TPA: hypothetical protein PK874_12850 [Desulfobacteraceae bacterium]|nr:hypothetical protein [Desulfobacteraceae bacterium]